MKFRIDTSRATFLAAKEPEVVIDPTTNSQKVTKDGQPLFQLQLVSIDDAGAEVLSVKVPGKPIGISAGTAVKVIGLTAATWQMGDRHGISLNADRVEGITAATK